jgi:glycosyltransferase involved in cell wall biosynthesis
MLSKILVVSQFSALQTGGAERYIHETFSRLTQRGYKLSWINPQLNDTDHCLTKPWQLFSSGYHPDWSKQLDSFISTIKPDIILAHYTVPGIVDIAVRSASKLHIPVCLVYHSDATGHHWIKRLSGTVYSKLIGSKTLSLSSALVISSPGFLKASSQFPSLKKLSIHYAPPGVDRIISQGLRRFDYPFLFFVGKATLHAKGFDLLYQAWLDCRRECPDLQLLVAGTMPTDIYPGVTFLGHINDRSILADLYASALVTILPSRISESFGMVLAEALVAGCPIIGARIGGIPYLVSDDVNGYLFNPGDMADLAVAIRRTLANQCRLRENIAGFHGRYLHSFNWDRTTDQLANALHAAFSPSQPPASKNIPYPPHESKLNILVQAGLPPAKESTATTTRRTR